MKSQQGREISEITFVQELLRRDLADALSVDTGSGKLELSRNDCTVPWQKLLTMKGSPASISPIKVSYLMVDGNLTRTTSAGPISDQLIALENFESKAQDSDLKVSVELSTGQRRRTLVWNFWCPAL